MNAEGSTGSNRERDFAKRFRELRQDDLTHAPVFPSEETLTQRQPVTSTRGLSRLAPRFAVAAMLLVAAGVLMNTGSTEDPGALYVDIMNANTIETDPFLSLATGALPGMTEVPEFYEVETFLNDVQMTN